ncbi:MAG: tRNA-dihydrouridine synthase family protein [Desulfovibrionaceae bacterium]|nr:tRNA-dihydrouridine synthase family protein [Desulfovibrionaceae bacterium]
MQITYTQHNTSALPFTKDAPWLAPMAGYSDLAFRLLARSYGAACCCTEMISAKGLIYQSKGTWPLLKTTPSDTPLIVQLFGAEPEFLAASVSLLREKGYSYFDLNVGCSVPKVMRQNAGAALLSNPQVLLDCASAMIKSAEPGHVGFKLRLGLDAQHPCPDIALSLEDLGAGWITLHPRYAKQYFKGTADLTKLTSLAKRIRIPLVASGDLFTAEQGVQCLSITNCNTVMYARGALRNPQIFQEHKALLNATPLPEKNLRELLCQYLHFVELAYPDRDQTKRMRGILAALVHGEPRAKEIRRALCQVEEWSKLYTLIDQFFPAK